MVKSGDFSVFFGGDGPWPHERFAPSLGKSWLCPCLRDHSDLFTMSGVRATGAPSVGGGGHGAASFRDEVKKLLYIPTYVTISSYWKYEVAEIIGENKFGGRWAWAPPSCPPLEKILGAPPSQRYRKEYPYEKFTYLWQNYEDSPSRRKMEGIKTRAGIMHLSGERAPTADPNRGREPRRGRAGSRPRAEVNRPTGAERRRAGPAPGDSCQVGGRRPPNRPTPTNLRELSHAHP